MSEYLQLWYGPLQVGIVRDAYHTDLNWYGELELTVSPHISPLAGRLLAFITFCVQWHERLDAANNTSDAEKTEPPDPSEFDEYNDMVESDHWATKTLNGTTQTIESPVFWPGGGLCWRTIGEPNEDRTHT